MFFIAELYLLIVKLFLAGKDASSYLLKDKSAEGILVGNRIKRWHRDGVALDILSVIPSAYIVGQEWWQLVISNILIRLSFFDIAFNKWAGIDITYLGSTSKFDRFFAKIFGIHGAVRKSLVFFMLLLTFNILKIIFKF